MDEEYKRMILEYQMLESTMQSLKQQENIAIQKIEEMHKTKIAIEELKSAKNGDVVMVPIGIDSFIKCKIEDSEKVLVLIGGIVVERKREDAIKIIEENMNEMQKAFNKILEEEHKIMHEMERMKVELEKAMPNK